MTQQARPSCDLLLSMGVALTATLRLFGGGPALTPDTALFFQQAPEPWELATLTF